MKKLILSLILLLGITSYACAQDVNDFYKTQVYSGGNVYTVENQTMRADKGNDTDGDLTYGFIARSSSEEAMLELAFQSKAGFKAHKIKIFLQNGTELQFDVTEPEKEKDGFLQTNTCRVKISYDQLEELYSSKRPYEIVIVDEDWYSYIFKDRKSQYKKIRKGMTLLFEDIAQVRAQGPISPKKAICPEK